MSSSFHSNIPRINKNITGGSRELIKKTLLEIRSRAQQSFSEPKTGIIYPRGKGEHQASAPGQPPAIDYGTLHNSFSEPRFESDTVGYIGVGAEYAAYLEFGTIYMAPRPYLQPAAEEVKPKFLAALKNLPK